MHLNAIHPCTERVREDVIPRRRRTAALTAALALAAAPVAGVALAAPAQAHDELLSSTPEAGQTLTEAPDEVSLTFSGNLIDGQGIQNLIRVRDADGNQWQADSGTVEGDTFSAAVCPDLPNGDYELAYRVVYSDGHSEERRLDFTLDAEGAPEAGTVPEDCGVAAESAGGSAAEEATDASQAAEENGQAAQASGDPAATTEAQDDQAQEPGLPGWVWGLGLGGVAVIGLAAVLMFRKASALGHTDTPEDR
ncbi:copper resistance CopC family protein [Micrococcus sp. FDAARGOS_333]|uniref:copper resistance CopC family protein n=1 Tax=Micrococcus sp. FDAARGOS_333 TaxID=1930558 RepID=UPI000B4E2B1C|nr:copper resistance CopC family protein [Micrococcus sp. FDAARGOS_333]PNL18661.1 copper resistance protein CopC [Micrococcus sp. FDAARGOS_333]